MSKLKKGKKVIVVSTGDMGTVEDIDYYEDGDIDLVHVKIGASKIACTESELLTHRGAYRALQAAQKHTKDAEQRTRNATRQAADANIALISAGVIPVAVLKGLLAASANVGWESEEDNTLSFSSVGLQGRVWHTASLKLELTSAGEFGNEYIQAIGEALR